MTRKEGRGVNKNPCHTSRIDVMRSTMTSYPKVRTLYTVQTESKKICDGDGSLFIIIHLEETKQRQQNLK